jgi:hypothetical protein
VERCPLIAFKARLLLSLAPGFLLLLLPAGAAAQPDIHSQ